MADFELNLAEEREWHRRAVDAQAKASRAYHRLLEFAETQASGQIRHVARFVASVFDGQTFPMDPFDLRTVDVSISDDMLICLDALRWGKADLYKLVPDGHARVLAVCRMWNLEWPEAS